MRISTRSCALVLTVALAGPLGACASPPSVEEMARLPVVTYGEPAPAKDFVLHYKAGQPMPVTAAVSGSLLVQPARQTLTVATSRDIWLYKNWVSFDGKSWMRGDQVVSGEFKMTLPGLETGREPGGLAARFDTK